jgi:transcriptional regulator with XRE-family HTH domain
MGGMISLSEQRKKLRLTQKQMAELIGVSQSAVNKWENSDNIVPLYRRPLVAEHYRISLVDLEILCNAKKQQANFIRAIKRDPRTQGSEVLEYSSSDIGLALRDAGLSRDVEYKVYVPRHKKGMPNAGYKVRKKIIKF